jgi:hypothetical protein
MPEPKGHQQILNSSVVWIWPSHEELAATLMRRPNPPHYPRAQKTKAHELVTTGSPKHSGIPCANGFDGFLRARPGDRALLSPSSSAMRSIVTKLDISVGISGPHDFAVRSIVRSSGADKRPSHPASNV